MCLLGNLLNLSELNCSNTLYYSFNICRICGHFSFILIIYFYPSRGLLILIPWKSHCSIFYCFYIFCFIDLPSDLYYILSSVYFMFHFSFLKKHFKVETEVINIKLFKSKVGSLMNVPFLKYCFAISHKFLYLFSYSFISNTFSFPFDFFNQWVTYQCIL